MEACLTDVMGDDIHVLTKGMYLLGLFDEYRLDMLWCGKDFHGR